MGKARTTTGSLLTVSTLALGFIGAAATPAEASPASPLACTSPSWSNKDSATGTVITYEGTAPMHSGPNSGCPIINTMFSGDILFYHCYTVNSAGNTWTHLRLAGTQQQGWIWDEYLSNDGSHSRC